MDEPARHGTAGDAHRPDLVGQGKGQLAQQTGSAEITCLFLAGAIVIGVIARLGEGKPVGELVNGARDLLGVAVVIGLTRGIVAIMDAGMTTDTILHASKMGVAGLSQTAFFLVISGIEVGLSFFVPSHSGRSSIINSSSVAGLTGSPGLCAYVASKHAVLGLTRVAAAEWGARGIRVNCINPGPIESRMMESIEEGVSSGAAEAVHDGFAATIPMSRYGTPEEVAGVVAFLTSDGAAYVNGAAYTLDGGMTAA